MGGRGEKKRLLLVLRPGALPAEKSQECQGSASGKPPQDRGPLVPAIHGEQPLFLQLDGSFCCCKFIRKYTFSRDGKKKKKATAKSQISPQVHGVEKRRKSGSSVALFKAKNPRATEPRYQKQKCGAEMRGDISQSPGHHSRPDVCVACVPSVTVPKLVLFVSEKPYEE